MKRMTKKHALLSAAAAGLILCASVGSTMAYFTAHVSAGGAVPVSLTPPTTTIDEGFSSMTKHITITNTGAEDVYVRVKVFASTVSTEAPTAVDEADAAWTSGNDGYYYYNKVLTAGSATKLDIKINADDVSDDVTNYNVIVVQECTPAFANADGSYPAAADADWSTVLEAD